jgi:ABC-2 type transport system ATP-binding protein
MTGVSTMSAATVAASSTPRESGLALTGSPPAPPVRVNDVTRRFKGKAALCGVSLAVRETEIHALLGPNGAGKTTLLRVVGGLMDPSSGSVEIFGRDHRRYGRLLRQQIGLVPSGSRSFYLRISALENLVFFGRMYGLGRREAARRARAVLDDVGLAGCEGMRAQAMSTGMQRRLAMARALLAEPRILLIDEATHDLDPHGAEQVRSLVRGVAATRGAAVLWATQRVEEIRGFADTVTVLDQGTAAFSGSVVGFLSHAAAGGYIVRLAGSQPPPVEVLRQCLEDHAQVDQAEGDGGQFLIRPHGASPLGHSLDALSAGGFTVVSCTEEHPGAERAFLQITGNL